MFCLCRAARPAKVFVPLRHFPAFFAGEPLDSFEKFTPFVVERKENNTTGCGGKKFSRFFRYRRLPLKPNDFDRKTREKLANPLPSCRNERNRQFVGKFREKRGAILTLSITLQSLHPICR